MNSVTYILNHYSLHMCSQVYFAIFRTSIHTRTGLPVMHQYKNSFAFSTKHNTYYTISIVATASLVPLRGSFIFQENPNFLLIVLANVRLCAPIHFTAGSQKFLSFGSWQASTFWLFFLRPLY